MSIVAKRTNGEGSKARKRKDGRYETRAVLDTPTGRRRVSYYGATAREANAKRTAALADQDRGVLFSDPKALKVGEYLSSWLSDAARYQVSEGTYQRYERTCQNHLIPFFGQLKLRDLSTAHVRVYKARKLEEGLNPNTPSASCKAYYPWRSTKRWTTASYRPTPPPRVKKAAVRGESPMRALSNEEASRLILAAEGTRDEALITLALRTGMRQGELAALRWEDLDLSERR